MLVTPDFSEVQDTVETGIYKARVIGSKLDKWEKDGKTIPFLNWELETFGESDEKNNGRKIFHRTAISGKGAFRLKQFYKAVMGEEIAGEFDAEMLYGRELEVTVGEQTDKDKNPTGYFEIKTTKPLKAATN